MRYHDVLYLAKLSLGWVQDLVALENTVGKDIAHATQDTTFCFMTPRLRQFANKQMPPYCGYAALGLLLCGPGFRAALPRGMQIAVQRTHTQDVHHIIHAHRELQSEDNLHVNACVHTPRRMHV